MKRSGIGAVFGALSALAFVGAVGEGAASAAPRLRAQADQAGDFALIGNTLGHDCRKSTPVPARGTVRGCGADTATIHDSAPDVFWRADAPEAGRAEASADIAADQARTVAALELPEGAKVTHAFLYWGAHNVAGADEEVTVDREGGFSEAVDAEDSWEVTINQGKPDEAHFYQSVADVTDLVQQNGPGGYRVGGVDVVEVLDVDDTRTFAGWWMVVLYEDPSAPVRNLTVFDSLDRVSKSNPQSFALDGIRAPDGGLTAKLGIIGYEGDENVFGDRLYINPASAAPGPEEAIGDPLNPSDNFFNGSRGWLGDAVSVKGDLPQLTGEPQSMPGFDIDVVDVTARINAGATSINVLATADEVDGEAELYLLGGWVSSIGPGPDKPKPAAAPPYLAGNGMFAACAAAPGGGRTSSPWLLAAALGAGVAVRRLGRRRLRGAARCTR